MKQKRIQPGASPKPAKSEAQRLNDARIHALANMKNHEAAYMKFLEHLSGKLESKQAQLNREKSKLDDLLSKHSKVVVKLVTSYFDELKEQWVATYQNTIEEKVISVISNHIRKAKQKLSKIKKISESFVQGNFEEDLLEYAIEKDLKETTNAINSLMDEIDSSTGEVADATVTLCFRKERIHQFFASLHDLVQFSCDSQQPLPQNRSESGRVDKSERGSPSQDDACLRKLVQDTKQGASPSSRKKPKESYAEDEKENVLPGNPRSRSGTSSKEIFDLDQNSVSDLLNAKLAATKKISRRTNPLPLTPQESIEEAPPQAEQQKSRFCLHFFQQRSNKLHLITQQADGKFFKEQVELGDFIIPRYHKSLMTKEGVVILTGGFANDQPSKKTFLVDIETQIMVETSEMNIGRTGHILLSHCGLIYAIGGVTEEEKVTDTCEVFSPQLNTWNEIARLNEGCHSACAISMNGSIYKFGGKNDDGEVCQVIEKFTGREWVQIKFDPSRFVMYSSSLAFQINSQEMMIVGGTAGDYQEKTGETFIMSISANPKDHKVSIRPGPPLPAKEGFWSQDVEFIGDSAYILQNISDQRDRRNVHLDERRLIQLDLNTLNWSILPVNN